MYKKYDTITFYENNKLHHYVYGTYTLMRDLSDKSLDNLKKQFIKLYKEFSIKKFIKFLEENYTIVKTNNHTILYQSGKLIRR